MDKESLRVLLQRAEEIQSQQEFKLAESPSDQEVLDAAEEAGLDRAAVEQALRERMSLQSRALQAGDMVFAPTPDGFHRVATVLATDDHGVDIRYVSGADHRVSRFGIRPFALLPGERIQAPWPNWGWWTCTVVSYDRELRTVRLSDGWGNEERFSIADLRGDFRPRTPAMARWEGLKYKIAIGLGGGAVGIAIGLLLGRLF